MIEYSFGKVFSKIEYLFTKENFKLILKSIPITLFVVILVEIKVFPIFVFSYIKSKYGIVVTDILT